MDTMSGRPVQALPAVIMRRAVSPVTRVVVGVDGSAGSAAALGWAAAEACRRETVLRIVSAWDEPRKQRPPYAGDPAQSAVARVQNALATSCASPTISAA